MVDVALATLSVRGRALVSFPSGRDYLIMVDGAEGAVVAEVAARDRERRVSLRPGRYFVRGRARDHLLEGTIAVRAGDRRAVDDGVLERVEYARLVRKGGPRRSAESVEAGYTVRTPLWSGAAPCQGIVLGWGIDFPILSVSVRGRACRGGFSNAYLDTTNDELGAEVRSCAPGMRTPSPLPAVCWPERRWYTSISMGTDRRRRAPLPWLKSVWPRS